VKTEGRDHPIELDLRVPTGPRAPAYARTLVSAFHDHVSTDVLDDLVLLVSEVVTNVVRHSGQAPGEAIDLRIRATRSSVRLEVVDQGSGFEPSAVRVHDPAEPGGWGLYIVDRLADRWGVVRQGGSLVWFEIDAGPEGRRARVVQEHAIALPVVLPDSPTTAPTKG